MFHRWRLGDAPGGAGARISCQWREVAPWRAPRGRGLGSVAKKGMGLPALISRDPDRHLPVGQGAKGLDGSGGRVGRARAEQAVHLGAAMGGFVDE